MAAYTKAYGGFGWAMCQKCLRQVGFNGANNYGSTFLEPTHSKFWFGLIWSVWVDLFGQFAFGLFVLVRLGWNRME